MWLIYALLSALMAAGVAIISKLGLKNADTILATTIRSMVMFLFLLAVSFSFGKFNDFKFSSLGGKDWTLIVLAGIFGALSWLFYFLALKIGQVTPVAAIDRLSIAFVFIFSLLFLGEQFSIKSLIGVVLMIAGAIFLSTI